jgi:hypothetical protein
MEADNAHVLLADQSMHLQSKHIIDAYRERMETAVSFRKGRKRNFNDFYFLDDDVYFTNTPLKNDKKAGGGGFSSRSSSDKSASAASSSQRSNVSTGSLPNRAPFDFFEDDDEFDADLEEAQASHQYKFRCGC